MLRRLSNMSFRAKALSGALLGFGAVAAKADEGTRRSLTFWRVVGPIYAHYRWTQYRLRDVPDEEADVEWNRLHDKYAPTIRENIIKLKGFYLKNAQIMSTQDQFVPPQYLEVCKQMQDRVPTDFVPGQAQKLIEAELGKPLESVFSEFDDAPIGAASIGQVHRAKLLDGTDVVVKLQYPGIERKFRADVATIIRFARLAMPQHVAPMEEIQRQFESEFDYEKEATHMKIIHDNLERSGWFDRVVVPLPFKQLCTRKMLVMTPVPGIKLVDGLRNQFKEYAESRGISAEDMEKEEKELIKKNQENPQALDAYERKMRFYTLLGQTSDFFQNFFLGLFNYTAGWVVKPIEYVHTPAPINLGSVLRTLNEVHAHTILVDGYFNGDPHPGNILLTPDGRLGLIDYGQVGIMNDRIRLLYAECIDALADDRKDDIVRLSIACGARTKYMKDDVLYRLAVFWNDRDTKEITGGRNLSDFLDWLEAEDPMEAVAEDTLMASRVSILLRGAGNAFGIKFRTATLWAPIARKVLADEKRRKQALQ